MKEPLKMTFGRYKGMPVAEVPPDYAQWLLAQKNPPKGWLGEAVKERAAGKTPTIPKWAPKPPDMVL